ELMSVVLGDAVYPDNVIKALETSDAKVIHFDALKAAEEQGSVKTVNIILCGVLSRMITDIEPEIWSKALKMTVAPKFLEMNERAFAAGASIEI
ncbi:MAG: 2-oxoacid:acceptor oxidoreductase family protein, partial [Clostridia bacterium]|nr:2-oxoacid:acceptor oxidoreductase family protein [Clostridia bacterium]